MDARTLAVVVEGGAYLYEAAAYAGLKSAAFGAGLLAGGLTQAAAVAVVNAWTAESAALIHRLRGRPLGAPDVLLGSSWRLTLGMGDTGAAGGAGGAAPAASVDLVLGAPDAGGGGAGAGAAPGGGQVVPGVPTRVVTLDFTRKGLVDFLSKLDVIQGQLDALS